MTIGEYIPTFLPCPFCGQAATYGPRTDGNDNGPDHYYVEVGCEDCGYKMEARVDDHIDGYRLFCRTYGWEKWQKPHYGKKAIDCKKDAENANAAADIRGYLELEKMWNRRT